MNRFSFFFLILGLVFQSNCFSQNNQFSISRADNTQLFISSKASSFDSLIAGFLSSDIERVTGYRPQINTDVSKLTSNAIVIGCIEDQEIGKLILDKNLIKKLEGKWEQFAITRQINSPNQKSNPVLIVGSDHRGMAYGVFHFSELIGVSPWIWWADVYPVQKEELSIPVREYISKPPSVKYRGIFLNDEEWGLQPWAAKTLEPETGDIGPKTYKQIFELLLRLKANTLWPAMHHCTQAFFKNQDNIEMAERFRIFIGSSHAEPMLRNNVDEWDKSIRGEYNYQMNKENVYKYWEERVKETRNINAIYTVGMRGIHDSGMEGFENMDAKKHALNTIITDQRKLLSTYSEKNLEEIPQVFIPYKEVLDLYDNGLKIPEDITLMWTDDNYGYIRRLPNSEERKRTGGNGIYYHISYWGRPHDYLWLSTTHPLLIWEEMSKAWYNDAKQIWIVNVGDIKPAEYNMELFLDMAYNIEQFTTTEDVWKHHNRWAETILPGKGSEITGLFKTYYNLAWLRKPEFMGWSQVEYKTQVSNTEFSHFNNRDEVWNRLNDYKLLRKKVNQLKVDVHPDNLNAYFQLVEYPIKCTGWMNEKFLFLEKAYIYASQQRTSANEYALKAKSAYDSIIEFTSYYNQTMANGKWNYIMDMAPRRLPVFEMPMVPKWDNGNQSGAHFALEGFTNEAYANNGTWYLPAFSSGQQINRFIDIYLRGDEGANWELINKTPWINISKVKGTLNNLPGEREERIYVSIDWEKTSQKGKNEGIILFKSGEKISIIGVKALLFTGEKEKADFVDNQGVVSIQAANFSSINSDNYQIIDDWGYTGKVLVLNKDFNFIEDNPVHPKVEYKFHSSYSGNCIVRIYSIPVHPVTKADELKLHVSFDQEEPQELNFRTYGRSAEWKQNVLSNTAVKEVKMKIPQAGYHSLYLEGVNPGIMIDRIEIDFTGQKSTYMSLPETRNYNY